MNTALKVTRCALSSSVSFYPITYTSYIPQICEGDRLTYLGLVKNKPHYMNEHNEVYTSDNDGGLIYVAHWLEKYKMLWTDQPVIYRLKTLKAVDFFYDVDYKDAYYYNSNTNLIQPIGYYHNKTDTFSQTLN